MKALGFQAAIFDMDGVVTRTAQLHASAWKALFDDFLRSRDGAGFRAFDERIDYRAYVDGKPRREGVKSFLRSREISLGEEEEAKLAARKDALFEERLQRHGVETFASTVKLIGALRDAGVRIGMVTSSRHGREILRAAMIDELFDAKSDGIDLAEQALKGKPDPDQFLRCAEALGTVPGRALVFEDAVAGVRAGRRGGFGLVVGVDRVGEPGALATAGADLVVADLGELDLARLEEAFRARQEDIGWSVEADGFEAAREHTMESVFVLGNGYLGVRGALDTPLPGSQADLFVAGVYDKKRPHLPYSEVEFLAPERGDDPLAELVPLPFPFRLHAAVDGIAVDFAGPHGRELRRDLDMRRGFLVMESVFQTPGGRRTRLRTRRCASFADPHLLLHEARLEAQNHWAPLELSATLEAPHLEEQHPHLELVQHVTTPELELSHYRTRASRLEVCMAARVEREAGALRRLVAIYTSRDVPDPRDAAIAHLQAIEWRDFDALFAAHEEKWAAFWQAADMRVPDRPGTEQALRFTAWHLRIAAGDDPRVSVPARSLSGRAYEGHVFWDTEIFMLPFYLHVSPPQARNLLLFRHHTLDGARRRARSLGYRGACYAWESTVAGDDVTPTEIVLKSSGKEIPIFTGTQQVHVTADIAYAVLRYWEATQDEAFLEGPGADILFETARFWISRMERGERHYHLRGVVGPDEYHHGVNDNAYTNWMARFNLERAAWLAGRLGAHEGEAQEWEGRAKGLFCPGPNEHGVIEQFEGFFSLGDYPLGSEERFKAPVSRLFDWDKINRLKLIKQADVLMLPLLFPDAFSDEVVAANYRYYEPLTDHGSSLSPPVHAAIAARIGLREDAERYWKQALWLDLSNAMDNSALGVHPAAMGGTWQALVFGFLGTRFTDAGPQPDARAASRLPSAWPSVSLTLAWRGKSYSLEVPKP